MKRLGPDQILRFLNRKGAWGYGDWQNGHRFVELVYRGTERRRCCLAAIKAMSRIGELDWGDGTFLRLSELGRKVAAKYPAWRPGE